MKNKNFDRVINLHIDNQLLKNIESYAKKKAWNRSFVIREAIKEYLDRRKNES